MKKILNAEKGENGFRNKSFNFVLTLGLTDIEEEGSWNWERTGTVLSNAMRVWAPNQPDNWKQGEHCAHTLDYAIAQAHGLLNDINCDEGKRIVCEKN